jgi:hypothetical protein
MNSYLLLLLLAQCVSVGSSAYYSLSGTQAEEASSCHMFLTTILAGARELKSLADSQRIHLKVA